MNLILIETHHFTILCGSPLDFHLFWVDCISSQVKNTVFANFPPLLFIKCPTTLPFSIATIAYLSMLNFSRLHLTLQSLSNSGNPCLDSPFDSSWNSEKSILNSQKDARLWAAIMEILLMFYCFLSNDKSNAFRIGIQLFTPYSQKKNIQCFFIFMPFFFENFDFSNPRIFELFNLSIGSLKNQDIVTCNRIRIL